MGVVQSCLDSIAGGSGADVFTLNAGSQLVSMSTGRCVSLAGSGALLMQECEDAAYAGDSRSTFVLTPSSQLKFEALGDYCLSASASGASAASCTAAGAVIMTAVPEFDPAPLALVEDAANLLRAATARQSALLEDLKVHRSKMGACKLFAQSNMSLALEEVPFTAVMSSTTHKVLLEPALEASSKIDVKYNIDLDAVKDLISTSKAILSAAP